MGNPVLSRDSIADYSSIYYQWGLVDTQGMLAVKPLQDAYNKAILDGDSDSASLVIRSIPNSMHMCSQKRPLGALVLFKSTLYSGLEFL